MTYMGGGIRKCLMQVLREVSHTARHATIGNGLRVDEKKVGHTSNRLKSRVPVACDYRASGAVTSDASQGLPLTFINSRENS